MITTREELDSNTGGGGEGCSGPRGEAVSGGEVTRPPAGDSDTARLGISTLPSQRRDSRV